ncbi:hypothetical protein PPERSA_10079 [Pseudocohnilembus persalinus]|uniref:Uncharacterized protein n=1 Tax=Pseudocohnilembus persalinus TaxID=266149 RepID=A0A0V0QJN2_PSEPJ|nr:hypothetical protein PPERSA_10079 [Pseudocohnilembus persalinus]|eukprot:KRX02462.1 hypothetical protein PPERSA_10079 [Pseudocohnilembus persalinus]
MIALILYAYNFSNEKKKNVFNILSVWSLVYPQDHLWDINDNKQMKIIQQNSIHNDTSSKDELEKQLKLLNDQFKKQINLNCIQEKAEQQKQLQCDQYQFQQNEQILNECNQNQFYSIKQDNYCPTFISNSQSSTASCSL